MQTRYLTIVKFYKDVDVTKAKGLLFPHLRGTWLPSFDRQVFEFGFAINWIGFRVRMSNKPKRRKNHGKSKHDSARQKMASGIGCSSIS